MTPDELVRLLEDMRDRAAAAAPAVAMEMARVYSVHLSRVTLRRTEAAPGQFGTPAPPGSPPAFRSGLLAESVTHWPGPSSGMTGRAYAGPHTIYAVTQEVGADPLRTPEFRYMHWTKHAAANGGRSGSISRPGPTCSLPWPRWSLTGRCSGRRH